MSTTPVQVGPVKVGGEKLVLIAGPCVVEAPDLMHRTADALAQLGVRLDLQIIFKSSFLKDNRSKLESPVGPGLEAGLRILEDVKARSGLPVTTDVHQPQQVPAAAEVVDLLQIPAFLCMQTSLLRAAAESGKPVNVKRGQFLGLDELANPIRKLEGLGAQGVLSTERGVSMGYGEIVVDPRAFWYHRRTGWPVVYDLTHSSKYRLPPREQVEDRQSFLTALGRSALGVGVHALFIETHPDPDQALSDGVCAVELDGLEPLLRALLK